MCQCSICEIHNYVNNPYNSEYEPKEYKREEELYTAEYGIWDIETEVLDDEGLCFWERKIYTEKDFDLINLTWGCICENCINYVYELGVIKVLTNALQR